MTIIDARGQCEQMTKTPLDRIARLFNNGHAALMPYFPLGFPDAETSLDVITAMSEAGADAFEIGLSFSDPLADGPVIQHATQVALEQGHHGEASRWR